MKRSLVTLGWRLSSNITRLLPQCVVLFNKISVVHNKIEKPVPHKGSAVTMMTHIELFS